MVTLQIELYKKIFKEAFQMTDIVPNYVNCLVIETVI